MATYLYLACPVCGATRPADKFGISGDGDFVPAEAPSYRLKASVKETGSGYRGIRWQHHRPTQNVRIALRHRLQDELDSLDAFLEGEDAERLSCLACGNMAASESFGIDDHKFDADNAPEHEAALEVSMETDDKGFVWQRRRLPASDARALIQSLHAAADRLEAMVEAAGG